MDWRDDAMHIHETVVKDWPVYSAEDTHFLALALGGECGELQNVIKKLWRGDLSITNETLTRIEDEIADVRIYLELLAASFGIDVDKACEAKIPELYRRWPETQPARPEADAAETGVG